MTTIAMKPRVTSLAPQFLVDDLERSMAYYRRLGFTRSGLHLSLRTDYPPQLHFNLRDSKAGEPGPTVVLY